MTAAKGKANSSIGSYDFVVWYGGISYDTVSILANQTTGNLVLNISNVVLCIGLNNCYYKEARVPYGTPPSNPNDDDVLCYGQLCYQGVSFPPLPPANIIELEVLDANTTTQQITAQTMRSNFRSYFYYAIAGDTSSSLTTGSCSSKCYTLPNHCCMIVNATDSNSGMNIHDDLCMN